MKNPKKMKIDVGATFLDAESNEWRVVDRLPLGRARLIRTDRCSIRELPYADIRSNMTVVNASQ
jgi:hypothetical protein